MNVDDLYNHIIKHMTPEEALKKFLAGGLISYEKLKWENPAEAIHPELIIFFATCELGWDVAIEKDQTVIRGLSVGTREYLDRIFKKI